MTGSTARVKLVTPEEEDFNISVAHLIREIADNIGLQPELSFTSSLQKKPGCKEIVAAVYQTSSFAKVVI